MGAYELAVLGSVSAAERETLSATLGSMVDDFGLALDVDVIVHDASSINVRDKRAALACAYFGGVPHLDLDAAHELMKASVPIIPTIAVGGEFNPQIPEFLRPANGLLRRRDDAAMTELASALLECVGLLRKQRRVFVSYRRTESRAAALQLHDLLSARGFDVFLDTHAIRPGDPFQDVLWHRLVDSDVVVMLDTPGYFDSRWTRQELGRARAKDIHVLRVIWPEHTPNKLADLAETVYLEQAELAAHDGPLVADTADAIVLRVERLRSRSIAARYRAIVGKLRADIEQVGGVVEGIGAHRAVALRLPDDRRLWAYPIVGVPTAEILNDVAEKAERASPGEAPVLVYDHVGIRDAWSAHLEWLDRHIRVVRAIKVFEAGWRLVAWED